MGQEQLARFVNVDPDTLDIAISDQKQSPMAIPTACTGSECMPPMWETVYYHHVYRERSLRQRELPPTKRTAACLAPPPAWLVAIAGVMWEGVIQGVAWDTVKWAIGRAVPKLQAGGLVPHIPASKETTHSVQAGWREYSTSHKKQYELFLSIKRTVRRLPTRHALAYARAANEMEFGKIVRAEMDVHPAKGLATPARTHPKAATKKRVRK